MDQYQQESHEMVFERVVGRDVDELFCPVCGRRILVQWSPDFKKTVLEPGDENAIHTASKAGVAGSTGETASAPAQESVPALAGEAERLAQWEVWLNEINFENLWR